MISKPFMGLKVPGDTSTPPKRRYSVTSDILAFRRCPRHYGAVAVHKYAPAMQSQLYFGTVIHQVLDRCHAYFQGKMNPATKGKLPTDDDVETFFDDVQKGLRSHGIYATSSYLRDKALRVLKLFNSLEGPHLYPRVVDTEHRLQADQGSHILYGVVDLLAQTPSASSYPQDCEMWDYKGTRRPNSSKDLENYLFQMRVYARLYQLKHGVLPKRALLYFLNELDDEKISVEERRKRAVMEVPLSPSEIDRAMKVFQKTVKDIEEARAKDQWKPARTFFDDCVDCDFRWDCPTARAKIPPRFP